LDHFKIRPLSEIDVDGIIAAAGGRRAHPYADRRDKPGSDYVLGDTLLELKCLDDEGLSKPERQLKLANLFRQHVPDRPVIVLDREALPPEGQRDYDRLLEGPIKAAVAKARKQLDQSRSEHPAVNSSVLFVINNGYTALDHEALMRIVAHRVRNDTTRIGGVVVAGCYFYSDSFDSYFIWPIDHIPIHLDRPFESFDKLRLAWSAFSERFMTNVVREKTPPGVIKGPVVDTQFDHEGTTFVKPAPPMGIPSGFFKQGRPRDDSTNMTTCPPVAVVFPELGPDQWEQFSEAFNRAAPVFDDYSHWQQERSVAIASGKTLKPCVLIPVKFGDWDVWRKDNGDQIAPSSLFRYATTLFQTQVREIALSARERTPGSVLPARYLLAVTEEIGQDRANDLSHILMIQQRVGSDDDVRELATDLRIFHEHAVALASSYAVLHRVESVFWQKDITSAWT
jgi:hypothetical protein